MMPVNQEKLPFPSDHSENNSGASKIAYYFLFCQIAPVIPAAGPVPACAGFMNIIKTGCFLRIFLRRIIFTCFNAENRLGSRTGCCKFPVLRMRKIFPHLHAYFLSYFRMIQVPFFHAFLIFYCQLRVLPFSLCSLSQTLPNRGIIIKCFPVFSANPSPVVLILPIANCSFP